MRTGALGMWHDRLLQPGQDWAKEIDDNIEASPMVLLVSADFLDSEYRIGIELGSALERHRSEAGAMRAVPILVRPCPWQMEPALEELQVLLSGRKAGDQVEPERRRMDGRRRRAVSDHPRAGGLATCPGRSRAGGDVCFVADRVARCYRQRRVDVVGVESLEGRAAAAARLARCSDGVGRSSL